MGVEEVRTKGFAIVHEPSISSRSETIPTTPAEKAVELFLAGGAIFVEAWRDGGDAFHDSPTMNLRGRCVFALLCWIPISRCRVSLEKPAASRYGSIFLTVPTDCGNFLGYLVINRRTDRTGGNLDLLVAEDYHMTSASVIPPTHRYNVATARACGVAHHEVRQA